MMVSSSLIPPPESADATTMDGLKSAMHLFEPRHFLILFLTHALGTLDGSFVAARIPVTHNMKFAIAIGVFFLLGGITAVFMLLSPTWFTVVDIVFAYIPMAWLGGKLSLKK